MLNINVNQPIGSKASQLLSWGHWFTVSQILVLLVISSSYLLAEPLPKTNLGMIYLIVTWLGHIGFLTFIGFVLTLFPLSLVFPYPRHIRGLAAALATMAAMTMALDAYVYNNLGYHFSVNTFAEVWDWLGQSLSQAPGRSAAIITILAVAVFTVNLIASNHTWRHLYELRVNRRVAGKITAATFVSCFCLSHLIHIWADAKQLTDVLKQDAVLPLSYPTTAKSLLKKYRLIDENDTVSANLQHSLTVNPINAQCPAVALKPVTILLLQDSLYQQAILQLTTSLAGTEMPRVYLPSDADELQQQLFNGLPALYNIHTPQFSAALNLHEANGQLQNSSGDTVLNILTPQDIAQLQAIIARPSDSAWVIVNTKPHQQGLYVSRAWFSHPALNTAQIAFSFDITATVISEWWGCPQLAEQAVLGQSLRKKNTSLVKATYANNSIYAFKRDKLLSVDGNGNWQQQSASQGFLLDEKMDVALLTVALRQLRRLEQSSEQ